ncbi:MAG: YezD family protein [Chloroflexi bacterium]|nr:YezD family protein [Chloroflexota bacterium]
MMAEVLRAVESVQHGGITLVIQDGQIVQIDTTSKVHLMSKPRQRPSRQSGVVSTGAPPLRTG